MASSFLLHFINFLLLSEVSVTSCRGVNSSWRREKVTRAGNIYEFNLAENCWMHAEKVFVTGSLLGTTSWNFMLVSANNRLIEM
jgi:hypothetical protein